MQHYIACNIEYVYVTCNQLLLFLLLCYVKHVVDASCSVAISTHVHTIICTVIVRLCIHTNSIVRTHVWALFAREYACKTTRTLAHIIIIMFPLPNISGSSVFPPSTWLSPGYITVVYSSLYARSRVLDDVYAHDNEAL